MAPSPWIFPEASRELTAAQVERALRRPLPPDAPIAVHPKDYERHTGYKLEPPPAYFPNRADRRRMEREARRGPR